MPLIELADLTPFAEIDAAKAEAMIEDALALAAKAAPCILEPGFAHAGAAKAILRGAILRWNDSGSGALSAQSLTAGSFSSSTSMDTRTARRSLFFPSEITDLQALCSTGAGRGAYTITLGGDERPVEGPLWWG